MFKNVELRKLPAGSLCSIAAILETNNDWKKVMSLVPRNPRNTYDEYFEPKYNNEHIKQIEDHARMSNRKCAEILFEEWGTSGRIRPTLDTLKEVVKKAGIYRAADEIAEMLQGAPPNTVAKRRLTIDLPLCILRLVEQLWGARNGWEMEKEPPERPSEGPAAPIDTDVSLWLEHSTVQNLNGTTKQISDPRKGYRSLGNKTTLEMKQDPAEISQNVPNFSKIIMKTENSVNIESNSADGPGFQMSFPNVDVDSRGIATEILQNTNLIHFAYNDLEIITKRFSERLIFIPDPGQSKLAGKIGSGGFGEVYVGFHPDHGHLAVKRARSLLKFDQKPELALKVFNAEVKFLSKFRHNNIVPIVGYSKDGPSLCVVCEYIDGGSLEQKLYAKLLSEQQRINIMVGVAEGLKYLHANEKPAQLNDILEVAGTESQNSKKNNFVHGDVKTANILLTRDLVPKLCDFGLAKQYEATYNTTSPMGTSAYMAPEGFQGAITQKIDIYSYGICLLEMLTGLKSILVNHDKETVNIKLYVEESCSNNEINTVLDPFIDKWTKAKEIYALAKQCLENQRKSRPTAEEICEILYKIRY